MTRLRGALGRIALVAAAGTIALGAGEVIARVNGFQPFRRTYVGERSDGPSPNFVKDERTGWRIRPHHTFEQVVDGRTAVYRSNAQGFRADADFDTAETRPVVALIGDSFVFGIGVNAESTMAAHLGRALPAVAVYNFALPGTGMDQIWLSLRHQASRYRPRLIVAGFIDEDFERSQTAFRARQNFTKPLFRLEADTLRPARFEDRPNVLFRLVERHSALHQAWLVAWRNAGHERPVGDWWRLNGAIVRAMADDARRLGAPIVFVRMPRHVAMRDFRTFRELMAELAAPYLDLADPSVQRHSGLHFATDSHINDAGHRFVADALLAWIRIHLPELARPSPPT